MGATAKPRFTIVFLMLLGMGLSLSFPAEDVLDAIYNESEAVPCERTPVFSIDAPPLSARIAKAELNRGSALHSISLAKRCKLCREISARGQVTSVLSVRDSLTFIDQHLVLRC